MPTLQCFILDLEKRFETCADVSSDAKCLSSMSKNKCFVQNILGAGISSYVVTTMGIKD
jgi:hypothetical protein